MSPKVRTAVIAVLLAISVVVNLVFFVFAKIQKEAADNQLEVVLDLKDQLTRLENDCRAREDVANALRMQADAARVACEEKLLGASNKKK